MSKDLFFQTRENEVVKLSYDHTFTKKEATSTGIKLAKDVVDSGEISIHEAMANVARAKEVINALDSELRKHLPEEKFTGFGVEFTPVNGGATLNYKEDDMWVSLNKKLKDREELLKLAEKSDDIIYDSDGVQVNKVSKSFRKSSVSIKF